MAQANLQLGLALRDAGIESVAEHNREWLETARRHARWICQMRGSVTSDCLHNYFGNYQPTHPNCYGAVFKEPGWRCIGYTQSERPEAHGRRISVWARG